MEITKVNDLGFYNEQGVLNIPAKQYDTGRKFCFNIMADDEPFDLSECAVYLRILKSDNTQFQGHECCLVSGNSIIVDTSISNGNQILTSPGLNRCELHLTDKNGKSLTTWDFNIHVLPRVHNGENILSNNSWDLLDKIKNTIDDYLKKLEEHYFVLTADKDIAEGVPSLDENTKIPIEELYDASLTQKGITWLIDDIYSHSITAAATPNSVRQVNTLLDKEIERALETEKSIQSVINNNKPIWDDKYTKNEIDNKFSTLETNIDWKESVNTYSDIVTAYPNPEDGWTVNVKDTNYTYRYNSKEWIPISANVISKATAEVDGLLSKEDKAFVDSLIGMTYETTMEILNGTLTLPSTD